MSLDALRESTRAARIAAGAMFVVALALLWSLLPAQGLTDDDDFYAPAGISYADWLVDAVSSPGEAFSKKSIDRQFKPNHEHPPFAKYVIGLTHHATKGIGLFEDLDGARAGVALLCALMCLILVRLCWRPLGPVAAVSAALFTLSLPRFFFHSQVATLDVPVASMVVLTVAAYFWSEERRRWVWITGVVFGLALLTKLNAPFAALPATLYAILQRWRGFELRWFSSSRSLPHLVIPPIPGVLFAMAGIGPVVFLLGWPWLWFDTGKRFVEYVGFHLNHYPIYLFYEGEIYTKPFAPWHAPFTMAAGTIPLPLLVLGLIGTVVAIGALRQMVMGARADGDISPHSERTRLLSLVLLQAAAAISIVAFLGSPKYGGEKLFMPFFPLFMILAAEGLNTVVRAAAALLPTTEKLRPVLAGAFALLALVPGAVGSARYHGGFALSYYAEAIGGLPGATARGYERTYYDIADKELARWLDDNAGGAKVHFEPNHKEYARTYRWMKRDGVISKNVRLEKKRSRAEYLVLTHERRWSTYPRLLREHRTHEQVYEKRIDGVPLYTVYRRRR